jgi:tetratricopeptide (TPR) repeat protein
MKKQICVLFLITILTGSISVASAAQPSSKDYKKAEKLYTAKKYREAIELYQKVLSAVPVPDDISPADLHGRIADSHFQLGEFNNALISYRRTLLEQTRSERPMTQYWIGFCCFLTGRDDEAVRELLKIPELYPDSGMLVSTAYYWAGRASERMGNKEQAVAYFRKAGGNGKSTQARFAKKKAEEVKGR